MTTPDKRSEIEQLHRLYGSLTGQVVGLDGYRERVWYDFLKKGWTGEDLRLVVGHLNRKRANGATVRSFKFSNLVGNLDFFEEDLAEARAEARKPKPDCGRQQVLRATGRAAASVQDTSHKTAEILASAAFKELLALRDTL